MTAPPLSIRPEAEIEIQEAHNWYELQRQGLGDEFLIELRDALAAVELSPRRYPIVRGKVRRAILHRFPYSILYLAEPENTVVIACFHGKRDPRRWHSRH
ncbi:MAG TPA: type II toxin-antitoxin system RelE/ParE family toxin [Thermoanaerobaculia bacterium]|jgi:plasmid stabilization system protein ParE